MFNKKALIELAKSFGRFIWFGVLGLVVAFLTSLTMSGQINNQTVTFQGITVNLGIVIVAGVGFVIKSIDSYIHNHEGIKSNGIAPKFLQG